MTADRRATPSRTLVFATADSQSTTEDIDAAGQYLLSALRPYCSSTLIAVPANRVNSALRVSDSGVTHLPYDRDRGLAGILASLAAASPSLTHQLGEEILIVTDGLIGPLSDLDDLFSRLDAPGRSIRFLTKPDPTYDGEQGTESLALEPQFLQLSHNTLRSSELLVALNSASSLRDLLLALEPAGLTPGWLYGNSDEDYFLRSSTADIPLIPWATFTSDPLLLERWAVSARTAYSEVVKSGYPLDIFWSHLTHAVPPQVWYTNIALLDIPQSAAPKHKNALKTAVCAHVFYPDMLREMVRYASNIPSPVSLFITTDSAEKKASLEASLKELPYQAHFDHIEVRTVATNDGRDISAFLVDCGDVIRDEEFDLVVKMHSKRSVQDPQSVSSWFRSHLFENLFASSNHVAHIYNRFTNEPQLGMVFPPVIHMGLPTMGNGWTANRLPAERLGKRLGIDIPFDTHTPLSPYGSMFIARREALLPLVDANFRPNEFPRGDNYRDGSLAHVLERLYSYVVYSQGYYSRCVQTPGLAEISAVTLEYKLDTSSSYIHPHVLEQVKILDAGASGVPPVASIRSLVQRRVSARYPRFGESLTAGWMAGKKTRHAIRSKIASIRGA